MSSSHHRKGDPTVKDGHKSLSSKSYLNLKSGESPALGGQQKISRPKLGQLLIDAGLLGQPNFQHALINDN